MSAADKKFAYTNDFDGQSEAIKHVYYNSRTRDLFVVLHNDSIAGYRSVPQNVYTAFENSVSRGRFWNYYIKGKFTTQSGDIAGFVKVHPASSEAAQPKAPEFRVVVELSGKLTITGTAKDGEDALRQVQKMLAEGFEGQAKVKELTQTFV